MKILFEVVDPCPHFSRALQQIGNARGKKRTRCRSLDMRKHSYMHAVHAVAIKQGIHNTNCVVLADWVGTRDLSDRGAFADFLDCGILFQEFLEILVPPWHHLPGREARPFVI
jgi:hypothetical protein